MEQYEHWEDAETFFLPEFEEEPEMTNGSDPEIDPPDSESEHVAHMDRTSQMGNQASDDLSQMLLSKLNFQKEPDTVSNASNGTRSGAASRATSSRSSQTSPEGDGLRTAALEESGHTGPKATNGHRRTFSASTIPTAPLGLRPLLSAVLWRLHSGPDASNAAKSCILITNDRTTQTWAQKFGIAVKTIHQLRTAIQYEEREFKNRCKYVEKTQAAGTEPRTLLSYDDESDEDELVFVPRARGGNGVSRGGSTRAASSRKATAMPSAAPPLETPVDVAIEPIDPDSFSRSLGVSPVKQPSVDLSTQAGAARGIAGASRRMAGGRRGGSSRGAARGTGRGRGKLWVP